MKKLSPVTWLFPLAALLFLVGLGSYDLWPADEPRFAEVAREMIDSGDALVPRVNGERYLEKPPLFFWAIALCSLPQGEVSAWSARLPSVLGALLVLVFSYLLARDLFSRRVAMWTVLVLAAMARFWWQARTAQIDMFLTGFMTLALYALHRWDKDRGARWLLVLYASMAAGMLAKGPPALVFPLLFVFTYYWKRPADRRQLHWVIGTLAAIALTALWYLPARMAGADAAPEALEAGIGGNLFRNTIGRFFLGVSKAQWPWYYVQSIPVDILPWTLFLPWTLPWIWRKRNSNDAMRLLWCWVVPALIFFSLSIGKRALYLLPLYPVFGIWIAASVLDLMDAADRVPWRKRTGYVWAALLLLLGLAQAVLPFTEYSDALQWPVVAFSLVALLLGGYAICRVWLTDASRLHVLIASQMCVLLLAGACTILPVLNAYKSARAICEPVRVLSEAGAAFDLYSVGFSREEYVFYSKHFHTPILTDLVGKEDIAPENLLEVAALQRDAQKRIADAVEEVPIVDMANVSPEERDTLFQAIEDAIAEAGEKAERFREFEAAIMEEIARFTEIFASERPAFLFVQDEDWRWILPLHQTVPAYHVVRHMNVGRRDVLLLANDAGVALLDTHSPSS